MVETTVFGYDGISNVITNYYTHMDYERVQMDIVTINPVSKSFKKEIKKRKGNNFVFPDRNRKPFAYAMWLARVLKKGNYQIMHVHGCSATMAVEMFAAKLAGVKIRIAHSHNTECDHVTADKILRPFFNMWCNVGFACGKEAGEWLFPHKGFEVISNGVDVGKFCFNTKVREEFRRKYGIDGKLAIGHVGRFSEQKNHEKLLDIFECLSAKRRDVVLVLVGDGELRSQIEERSKRSGLNVLFVGLSNEVEKWLQAMDVMVFPSLFEGLPLGLVEAQAAALPCVLSDTISPMTKITDFVTFVKLDETPETWSRAIDLILSDFDRKSCSQKAVMQILEKHFGIRQNCDSLADKYEQLVKQHCT